MFSGIVSVLPWKDHFIQFILQIVVLIFHAENQIKKNKKIKIIFQYFHKHHLFSYNLVT